MTDIANIYIYMGLAMAALGALIGIPVALYERRSRQRREREIRQDELPSPETKRGSGHAGV